MNGHPSFTCQSKNRQLAGEGREEPRQLTQRRGPPEGVVDEVDASVVDVNGGYDQEIDAHAQVTQSEVGD